MADDEEDKTEEPTGRKLGKAREEGQIPYTKEFGSTLVIAGLAYVTYLYGDFALSGIRVLFISIFSNLSVWNYGAAPIASKLLPALRPITLFIGALLMIAYLLPIITHVLQKGPDPKFKAAQPKLEKLDPVKKAKQLVSMQSLTNFLKNFLKTLGLMFIFYLTIQPDLDKIVYIASVPFELSFSIAGSVFLRFFIYALIFLFALAVLDYYINYKQLMKSLRMSRKEVKDELKDVEGNPQIKGKVREIQMQRSKRTIQKEVPEATVVVTNPTHFAIALKYKKGEVVVPKVVAKGADYLAFKIRELAKEHKVPIIENPPLARALYREVKVGHEIPYKFYKAVAKIISTILRLKAAKKQQQQTQNYGTYNHPSYPS